MKDSLVAKMRLLIKCALPTICFLFAGPVFAEAVVPLETALQENQAALKELMRTSNLRERELFQRTSWQEHWTLSPHRRERYEAWYGFNQRYQTYHSAIRLKGDLLALQSVATRNDAEIGAEADQIARLIIETLDEYRQKWTMIQPALLHNLLVNVGVKEKGFCYHWVELFRERLSDLSLQHFQIHWGVAHQDKLHENNALVITPAGGVFAEGIAVDGWRESGRPFWVKVQGDKFPWRLRTEF